MADNDILQLQSETGCDLALAKLMLKFTDGDVEGAVKIIRSVEKNIYVIRGKFIAQTNKMYGAFIFFYDSKNKSIEKIHIIAKENDRTAIEFDFDKDWHMYLEEMQSYEKTHASDLNIQNSFISLLMSSKTTSYFDKVLSKKDIDENQIKNYINDVVLSITGDVNIALKFKFDRTDAFEMNRGNIKESDIHFEENKTEEDVKKSNKKLDNENNPALMLKIELDIAPVDGIPISELQHGELIAVKVVDDRPIAHYISGLLTGLSNIDMDFDKIVFAELKDLKVTENGILVKVEFGPGIYGEAYYGENVKVRVSSKDDLFNEKKVVKQNFFMKNFWIIGGVLIAIIAILLFILTQNNN